MSHFPTSYTSYDSPKIKKKKLHRLYVFLGLNFLKVLKLCIIYKAKLRVSDNTIYNYKLKKSELEWGH